MTRQRNFAEAMINRRSYYSISNASPVSDKEIEDIVRMALEHVPSAFNSHSTRLVLLLGEHHRKLWQIVKDQLRKRLPEELYRQSEQKIDRSFACGYGTVLFFEERAVVEALQAKFPTYRDNFPVWSQHTSAMHQFAVWTTTYVSLGTFPRAGNWWRRCLSVPLPPCRNQRNPMPRTIV